MVKVFITGITGFLGSNIAEHLIHNGCEIIATHRAASDKRLCGTFENSIIWILQDNEQWANKVINFKPDIIIHAAWIGVEYSERNLWETQLDNINFIKEILFVAEKSGSKKFIALGSQAEYGIFNGCVTEEHPLNPTEAYGKVKVICSELIKQFCDYYKIDWFWLRIFSMFGKGESNKWLIPTVVNNLLTTNHMDLTPGEQVYAYLYVEDFARAINKIININGQSGIYNISGKHAKSLKSLLTSIRDQVNPSFQLNFSKLNYRENQSMYMQGDVTKFVNEFGEFEISDFDKSLYLTVNNIKNNLTTNTK